MEVNNSQNQYNDDDYAYLQCFKIKNKLRVRIISHGYLSEANCQFPRNIRVEGRRFRVPKQFINFGRGPAGTFYYSILKRNYISILGDDFNVEITKIFENDDISECSICMFQPKTTVFAPCGHFVSCETCSFTIKNDLGICPICRQQILSLLNRNEIQL